MERNLAAMPGLLINTVTAQSPEPDDIEVIRLHTPADTS